VRLRQLLGLTFLGSFSAAAWPNERFGVWPALLTVLLAAWLFSPWLGGRMRSGRWLDAGLVGSLLTAGLALAAVQSPRGLLLGSVSAVLLLVTVTLRLVRSVRHAGPLPSTPAALLQRLLTEPPDPEP
jgi:hypothetical protein